MKNHHLISLVIVYCTLSVTFAQEEGFGLPHILTEQTECLNELERARIFDIIGRVGSSTYSQRTQKVTLQWPVQQSLNYTEKEVIAISNFVDWNTSFPEVITDYSCGTRSYDTESGYNHQGTDIYSWPFTWHKMDNDQIQIVAAAAGEVIYKEGDQADKSCSFNNNRWNAVYIQHPDGSVAWYGHLKTGSLTEKKVGEQVRAGDYLGIMGSSGNSTGPHLHLELYDANGNLIDPFAGECNNSTSESWWANQPAYTVPGISKVMTHHSPPAFGCYNSERPNMEIDFQHGEKVFFATYFRDQLEGSESTHTVYKPDGSVFNQWTTLSPQYYSGSYWYRSFTLPSSGDEGKWTFASSYNNDEESTFFYLTNDETDDLQFSTTSIILSDYTIGDELTETFEISNAGSNGVIITGINYPDQFSGNWDGILQVGELKSITFTFKAESSDPIDDVIEIQTTLGSFEIKVITEPTILGVEHVQNQLIYPNPAKNGVIHLNRKFDSVKILSLSGSVLYYQIGADKTIDVSKLHSGIYIMEMQKENQSIRQKLIIESH